jgi:hypothetical protein
VTRARPAPSATSGKLPGLLVLLAAAALVATAACNDSDPRPKAQGGKDGGEADEETIADSALEAMLTKQSKCDKKGNVWLPPTDDLDVEDADDGICGGKIAPLCCSIDGLKRKVIGSEAYEPRITALLDDGYQLYSCSSGEDNAIFLHFLKREKGELAYSELTLTQSTAAGSGAKSDDGDDADDPKACALDMDKVLRGKDGTKKAAGGAGKKDSPFTKTIAPLLVKYCDGGSCHGKDSTYSRYVGDEELVTARAKSLLDRIANDASPMPPKGSKELSSDDEQTLVDFLTPLAD